MQSVIRRSMTKRSTKAILWESEMPESCSEKSLKATTKAMMAELVDEDSEIIGIYYGEDVKEEDAQKLGDELAALYPNAEVEVHNGGQPIYYYVISVE